MRRILLLTWWSCREPAYWRVALLILLVLVFSLSSGVVRSSGFPDEPPERTIGTVLDGTASLAVAGAYPFLFPLVSLLATITIVAQRESGGHAALHALGYRRHEILLSATVSILVLVLLPVFIALVLLPPLVEPSLIGNPGRLYPGEYWASIPRLFFAVVFLVLFASAFALVIRRAATAFGAMITFFFVGWYIGGPLGSYRVFTPPWAFVSAYDLVPPLSGFPVDPNWAFVPYLATAVVFFVAAVSYASWRGELQ